MSISQCGGLLDKSVGNVSAISGMYTKRSPYITRFKNMDDADSLSMTPLSALNKSELTKKTLKDESENLKSSTSDLKQNNIKH